MNTFLLLLTLDLTCHSAPGATSTLNKASPPFDATGKMSSSESSDRTVLSRGMPGGHTVTRTSGGVLNRSHAYHDLDSLQNDGSHDDTCTEIDECLSVPCAARGLCTDLVDCFFCNCTEGFAGPVCELNVDECRSAPCTHGGTCIDAIAGYTCDCVSSSGGENCEVDETPCTTEEDDIVCPSDSTCAHTGPGRHLCSCHTGFDGTFDFPAEVVHWQWINEKTIGIVTSTAVFHSTIDGDAAPSEVFARHDSLNGVQIMSYKALSDIKWLVLNGISRDGSGQYVGKMQLYSIEKKVSQPINGSNAAGFSTITTPQGPLLLFCLANKTATAGQVQLVKIAGDATFQKTVVLAPFEDQPTPDFPVAMQASTKYDLLYLLTKNGMVHVYDTMIATVIYQNRVCTPDNP
eukprot:SAG22_NODE_391_length_11223_cov_7.451187_4_plen_404_part_00